MRAARFPEEIVIEPFEAVRVAARLALLPTLTLPKLSVEGLSVSWLLATPTPLSSSSAGELLALLMNSSCAVAAPAALGVNWIVA